MPLCSISFQIIQREVCMLQEEWWSLKTILQDFKKGRKQEQLRYKLQLHTVCTSLILAFNCGTSKAKPFQRYCMGKKSTRFCTQNSFLLPDGGEMKKPVLLFYKSASVCKLTTMLADSSMQNSFSSFGPKVPLAGETSTEQEAAWLPMSCQRKDIQLMLILSHCLFTSHRPKNTKLFSGLGHFQAATPTVY